MTWMINRQYTFSVCIFYASKRFKWRKHVTTKRYLWLNIDYSEVLFFTVTILPVISHHFDIVKAGSWEWGRKSPVSGVEVVLCPDQSWCNGYAL